MTGAASFGAGAQRHIAIIGGGASGVLMALHLLQQDDPGLRLTLIESRDLPGSGIAYSTQDPDHLLNTRVRNMSAIPDDPDHFRRWLIARPGGTGGGADDFVSRGVYGAYLLGLLRPWLSGAKRGLDCLRDTCSGLVRRDGGFELALASGRRLRADEVILATGHAAQPPDPLLTGAWDPVGAIDPFAPVVIIGTGLSMVDQVLSLLGAGHLGPITAISRRGLLPQDHAAGRPAPIAATDLPMGATASGWMRWLRDEARRAERAGGTWRDAVDGLRPHLRGIWPALPLVERARFLRHAVTWWEVHRHRIPPVSSATIRTAQATGQLELLRGRVAGVARAPQAGLIVRVRPVGGGDLQDLAAARVIDCRGIRRDPLGGQRSPLRALVQQGLARIDPLALGPEVAPDCRLLAADGQPVAGLYAIGPVSRAAFWEITAVPDIRDQTQILARRLAAPRHAAAV